MVKEQKREWEKWDGRLAFSFNSQGYFRDFLKVVSFLSISTFSLSFEFNYAWLEDFTSITNFSWTENIVFFFSLFLLENLNVNKSNIVNFTYQNAEDNEYREDVNPSLELVITSKDITGTGALMTLLIFNNEKGFSAKNIESICGVGRSTKKGNRKRGYIGEKGTFISWFFHSYFSIFHTLNLKGETLCPKL